MIYIIPILSVVCIIIAIYIYNRYMREKKIQTSVEVRVVDVYYFYTTWCPYCVKARPEWDKFKKFWENKKKNGYMLNFTEIDCDKNESLASKYEIETYPTIKLVKDGKVYDYDAKPSVENLNKFLNVCFE
jgi:thiol-disulfide isomerase/thioredoxin